MSEEKTVEVDKGIIEEMFKAGLQYGSHRARRHPSVRDFVYGVKNNSEIIDLEKTYGLINDAKSFVEELGRSGKQILLVANKNEAKKIIKDAAEKMEMPYVAQRWIGGTLTNFTEIRKRADRLIELKEKEEKGELGIYTKRERTILAREAGDLERIFGGIVDMKSLPAAVFVVDSGKEEIAVAEARKLSIPVVALGSTDCDIRIIDKPIVGNDSAVASIGYVVNQITEAYLEGKKKHVVTNPETAETPGAKVEKKA